MTPEEELHQLEKKQRKLNNKKAEARARAMERDKKAWAIYEESTRDLHNLQYLAWHEMTEEERNRYRRQAGTPEVPTS